MAAETPRAMVSERVSDTIQPPHGASLDVGADTSGLPIRAKKVDLVTLRPDSPSPDKAPQQTEPLPSFARIPRTEIDAAIDDMDIHASKWSTEERWRLEDCTYFGVHSKEDFTGTPDDEYNLEAPEKAWIAGVFGIKVHEDTERTDENGVLLEEMDIETMIAVQKRLAETVLQGEGAKVAIVIDPANPHGGVDDPANNNQWLQTMRDGRAPILRGSDHALGTSDFSGHDIGGHLGNMMLFPREAQDLLTEACARELDWRSQFTKRELAYMESEEKAKLLDGESATDLDPWSLVGYMRDGVDKIDELTDIVGYSDILSHLVAHKDRSVDELLDELHEAAKDTQYNDTSTYHGQATRAIRSIPRVLGDTLNFVTRHREDRNVKQEEVDTFVQGFWGGTKRVARKIRGEYQEEDTAA